MLQDKSYGDLRQAVRTLSNFIDQRLVADRESVVSAIQDQQTPQSQVVVIGRAQYGRFCLEMEGISRFSTSPEFGTSGVKIAGLPVVWDYHNLTRLEVI